MHIPRYKDSEFSKWCKSTGSELVKLPSKPQGRLASLIVTTFLRVGVTRGLTRSEAESTTEGSN